MEDLGYRVLTAQNGPEALSIERAVSRFTDLVMPHGISGAKLGSGYSARMSPAAAGLPNVPQSCVRFSRGVPN
jgi:CheY-like chemotaxis protein